MNSVCHPNCSHCSDFPSYLISGGDSIIGSSWFLSSNQNPNKVHSFWSIDRSLKLLSIYIPSPSSFLSLPMLLEMLPYLSCSWQAVFIETLTASSSPGKLFVNASYWVLPWKTPPEFLNVPQYSGGPAVAQNHGTHSFYTQGNWVPRSLRGWSGIMWPG